MIEESCAISIVMAKCDFAQEFRALCTRRNKNVVKSSFFVLFAGIVFTIFFIFSTIVSFFFSKLYTCFIDFYSCTSIGEYFEVCT